MASTQNVILRSAECTIANRGAEETIELFNMVAGDTVLFCYVVHLIASSGGTDSAFNVGDGGDTDRYVDGIDCDIAAGSYTTGTTATVPYTYTGDDTIDALYTQGSNDGTVNPSFRVVIGYVNASPA
jgi:hypothetical protein